MPSYPINSDTEALGMQKLRPATLNFSLGGIDAAQERRKAYEKAAKKEGLPLGSWIRRACDREAGYKEEKK